MLSCSLGWKNYSWKEIKIWGMDSHQQSNSLYRSDYLVWLWQKLHGPCIFYRILWVFHTTTNKDFIFIVPDKHAQNQTIEQVPESVILASKQTLRNFHVTSTASQLRIFYQKYDGKNSKALKKATGHQFKIIQIEINSQVMKRLLKVD